jgi:hypothetical protein
MSYYEFLANTQTHLKLDCCNVKREILKALRNGEIPEDQADLELFDLEKSKEYTEQLCNAIEGIMFRVKPYTYVEYITYKYNDAQDKTRLMIKRMHSHRQWSFAGQPNQYEDLQTKYYELKDLKVVYEKLIEKLVEPTEFCKMKNQGFPLLRPDVRPTDDEKKTFSQQLENDINYMKQKGIICS